MALFGSVILKPASAALIASALLWLGLINQLRVEWSINPQYSYGWGVPLLAAYLFWQRWTDRPAPERKGGGNWSIAAMVLAAVVLLPLRLVQEANPDWRLVSWTYAVVVCGASLAGAAFAGGARWARYFAFPILFIFLSVPWPSQFEQALVQGLMRGVAAVTVEALNWWGVPAVQRGNLIELPEGVIGVNEACSGVRSFQATLMVSLFLGEMYRLGIGRRIGLVGGGVLLGLGFNLARTFFLTWTGAREGDESVERWHDPAGFAVLAGVCVVLWGWAWVWRRRSELKEAGFGPQARLVPAGLSAGLAVWLVAIEVLTEAWYRSAEAPERRTVSWDFQWPEDENFEVTKIGSDVRSILRYNVGQAGLWLRPDGTQWLIYHFRWRPGRAAAQLARNHTPETCLPASGLKMTRYLGEREVKAGELRVPFQFYEFESRSRVLYVFYCLWEERHPELSGAPRADYSRTGRLKAVWRRQRHLGQQVVEIAMFGSPSASFAERQIRQFLERAIQPQAPE